MYSGYRELLKSSYVWNENRQHKLSKIGHVIDCNWKLPMCLLGGGAILSVF